jgi:cytochrome bd ubiquinol oxidase subunit II
MILFWTGTLALLLLLYVVLDGADLGVGILFGFNRDEEHRRLMLSAISPVWDGNETWLVLTAAVLFGAFPSVYATLLEAFYLPMIFLLAALILRGVAFEFRYKSTTMRWFWDSCFAGGSTLAAFIQGATVGALVEGLPMINGHYSGSAFSWLSPFAAICGLGLCLGYGLLGASWLVAKCEGTLRDRGYRHLPILLGNVFVFLAVAFAVALSENLRIMDRWLERPYLFVFPVIGAVAAAFLITGIRRRIDQYPLRMSIVIFVSAFATLAASFWPYMIPFAVTIEEAASPPSSLRFMFWGAGLVALPLTLMYTVAVYRIFSGKLVNDEAYE